MRKPQITGVQLSWESTCFASRGSSVRTRSSPPNEGSQLRWLERTPDKREVGGSSPLEPTIFGCFTFFCSPRIPIRLARKENANQHENTFCLFYVFCSLRIEIRVARKENANQNKIKRTDQSEYKRLYEQRSTSKKQIEYGERNRKGVRAQPFRNYSLFLLPYSLNICDAP